MLIKFSEAKNKQNEFLYKLSTIKIGKTTPEQKKVITNLENVYNSREEVIIFLETILKCCLMLITMQNLKQLKELVLKY